MIINPQVTEGGQTPKALVIGNSKVLNRGQLGNLANNYAKLLDVQYQRTLGYWAIELTNDKLLKKSYNTQMEEVTDWCEVNDVKTIVMIDAAAFKFATGKGLMKSLGSTVKGSGIWEGYTIIPWLSHFMTLRAPQLITEVQLGVKTLNDYLNGSYMDTVSKTASIEKLIVTDIQEATVLIDEYIGYDRVAIDIETTGLLMGVDSMITIAFAKGTESGFSVPLCSTYTDTPDVFRKLVQKFFLEFKGEQLWYNAMFDIPFILRDLFKLEPYEHKEVAEHINRFNIVDVMFLKYLSVNSISRQSLSLKDSLFEIYGEYDEDIDQANLIDYPFEKVAEYNVLDVTGTFEAYNKYLPKVLEDEQYDIFIDYYQPSLYTLLKMKFKGLQVDKDRLEGAYVELEELLKKEHEILNDSIYVKDLLEALNYNAMYAYNQSHVKQKKVEDFDLEFKPNSSQQKAILLIDIMGYKVLDTTATGNPSLGKDTLAKYITAEKDEGKLEVLNAILSIGDAAKVRNTFLKAFRDLSVEDGQGNWRIHGDFKLVGVISGRLSSANPNLQNLKMGAV